MGALRDFRHRRRARRAARAAGVPSEWWPGTSNHSVDSSYRTYEDAVDMGKAYLSDAYFRQAEAAAMMPLPEPGPEFKTWQEIGAVEAGDFKIKMDADMVEQMRADIMRPRAQDQPGEIRASIRPGGTFDGRYFTESVKSSSTSESGGSWAGAGESPLERLDREVDEVCAVARSGGFATGGIVGGAARLMRGPGKVFTGGQSMDISGSLANSIRNSIQHMVVPPREAGAARAAMSDAW